MSPLLIWHPLALQKETMGNHSPAFEATSGPSN